VLKGGREGTQLGHFREYVLIPHVSDIIFFHLHDISLGKETEQAAVSTNADHLAPREHKQQ
jgi:hypothetical protein